MKRLLMLTASYVFFFLKKQSRPAVKPFKQADSGYSDYKQNWHLISNIAQVILLADNVDYAD